VSADEDAGELRAFVARHSLTLPILLDPGGRVAARAYHTVGYPETFVLDRSGKLLHRIVGPAEWDTPEALDHFRSLLASSGTLTGWRKDPVARVGNSSLGSGVKRPVLARALGARRARPRRWTTPGFSPVLNTLTAPVESV